ncbi:MAG: prolyl-tRNA synthetase associated domain-containing protein [Alphaproteobacteria bacterium]|jgi:Ala-tRNA(Pro) deacylase|nr:prolyl-tRNA synthetase associated domain-containing protein [Alphaproteobacteria bacterium]
MAAPATPADLFERLDGLNISYKTISHPPLFTVDDSKALRGALDGGHAKNLFLKNKKGRMWLLMAEESAPINLKAFAKTISAGNLSFGKPELLMEMLGVIPGAVTPFALINAEPGSITPLFDQDLLAEDPLNFHPLDNTMTTTIAKADLLRFVEALGHRYEVVDLKAIEAA